MTDYTEIWIDEDGHESHESWLLIQADGRSTLGPGARLFGSDTPHQYHVVVTISRCIRTPDVDRLYETSVLMEIAMSQTQWGEFVSSFNRAGGVPATLRHLDGRDVPQVPTEASGP